MWDPKRMYQDRTPLPLEDAPRPIECRPVVQLTEKQVRRRETHLRRHPKRKTLLKYLGFVSYTAYLQSSLWQRIRKRIMMRADGVCELCHSQPSVIAHHLRYDWDTLSGQDDSGLLGVCVPCHDDWHQKRRRGTGQKRKHHGKRNKRRIFHWANGIGR